VSAEAPRPRPGTVKRSLARLAAVQALYQIDLGDAAPESAITELRERAAEEEGFGEADDELFVDLVRGAIANRDDIDALLSAALGPEWPLARLDAVLRALLRVGGYELLGRLEIPARVVLNEYLDIAHAFFSGKEPGLANGVLDRLAHRLRASELTAGGDAEAAG